MKVIPVLRKFDTAQLRWLGHLERMEEVRITKKKWNWKPRGNRPRGRPRKRWKDAVGETLERYDMPNLELQQHGTMQDRQEWRRRLACLTDNHL